MWQPSLPSEIGQPTWEIAQWFPTQGRWSERDYLALTESSSRLVELTHGRLEVLAMPTIEHQLLVIHLLECLRRYLADHPAGMVLMAPHPTWIGKGKYREPDLVFKLTANLPGPDEQYFRGADLAMEVVGPDPDSHRRDHVTKRADYAEAGIAEYWIVDPQTKTITVLALEGSQYAEHSTAVDTGAALSRLLAGFEVDAAALWAAAVRK